MTDEILSQASIDALIAKHSSSGEGTKLSPEVDTPLTNRDTSSISDTTHDLPAEVPNLEALISPLQATINTLAKRIEKIEAAMQAGNLPNKTAGDVKLLLESSTSTASTMIQLAKGIEGINEKVRMLSLNLQACLHLFEDMDSSIRDITRGLHNTPVYKVRETFQCERCGSRGYVTVPVRCEDCGEEHQWGWWPPEHG